MGLVDPILSVLSDAQIRCCKAFPNEKMPVLEEPIVLVGTKQLVLTPGAIDHNFGTKGDEVCRAALCEEDVLLDVYSPYLWGGRFCDKVTDQVLQIVLGSVMDYTFKTIRRAQSYYDPETDCYRNEIVITALAWLRLTED